MHLHRKLCLALLLISLTMAGAASAQTLSIVSGDGQLAQQFEIFGPMVVVVKDASGQPVPGVTVTWSVSGQGNLNTGISCDAARCTVTDANGRTSNQLVGGQVSGATFTQTVVTAAIVGSSVRFTETVSAVDPTTGNPVVPAELIFPELGDDPLTGSAGSTGTIPVVVQVGATGITGVPNVLIRLLPTNPDGPTITCSGLTGYTDLTGRATCFPVFAGTIGKGQYYVDVGGDGTFDTGRFFRRHGPRSFEVTKGAFATFRITGGDGQSGSPGATLPLTLTARTEDAAGNAVANEPVIWEAVVPNTVTISQQSSSSNAEGIVTAIATLGGSPGTVQVRLRNPSGTIQTLFTFQVNLIVSGLAKIAGDNQDAVVNSPYTQPLIVQVNTPQGPAAGVQVHFSTSGGVTFPNGPTATTDAFGRASINVSAGPTPGTAVVTAAVSNLTLSFNLTIRLAGPGITLNSFFNGAGGQPGGVSPSAVLAIYGTGIATGLQGCVAANQIIGPLPIQLSNVVVKFSVPSTGYEAYAPLYSVCNLGPGQEYVNLQVPTDLQVGAATVTVNVGASTTTLNNVPVTPFSPGIFETVMADGVKRAVLLHADGSYVMTDNKARPGEVLRAFVTGLGRPVSAAGVRIGSNRGGIPGDDASPTQPIVVGVANEGVRTISTVYAPYFIGVYIVTFQVQANPPIRGDNSPFAVAVSVNDVLQFGNPSKIPIQP